MQNILISVSFLNVITSTAEKLCLFFDKIIYQAVGGMYSIFMAVATADINDFSSLENIVVRITSLVAIFMLFKLTFSFLTYLIDPDKMTNEKTGAGKVVTNIFISLVMLAMVGTFFNYLNKFQSHLIEDQVINKLVLGSSTNLNALSGNKAKLEGQGMAAIMWSSFFITKVDKEDVGSKEGTACSTGVSDCKELITQISYAILGYDEDVDDIQNAYQDANINYIPIFSGLAGIFVIVMLMSFTIDVGVRLFKLLFYRIISPIAILSFIDENTKKNFWNWLKSVGMTFLDLFIRIAGVFLAIIIISAVAQAFGDSSSTIFKNLGGFSKTLAMFFLIIAAFTFAKMLPKLISDLFGLKLDGASLNPFKNPIFAGAAGALGGGALGLVGSVATGFASGKTVPGKILGGVTGGVTGGTRGLFNGAKTKGGKGIIKAGKGAISSNNAAIMKHKAAGGLGRYMKGSMFNALGITGRKDNMLAQGNAVKSKLADLKAARDKATLRRIESGHMYGDKTFASRDDFVSYATAASRANLAAAEDANDPEKIKAAKDQLAAQENYVEDFFTAQSNVTLSEAARGVNATGYDDVRQLMNEAADSSNGTKASFTVEDIESSASSTENITPKTAKDVISQQNRINDKALYDISNSDEYREAKAVEAAKK